ncbi:TerB family tellurite resistance protein [Aquincola sp. MAHUQ-54]|uniref:TerB family tellurite resistance protein n=1 Tax=Aquincola agrisoli TaxID=3119538 RepID=A0AAW9PYA6_9BURK
MLKTLKELFDALRTPAAGGGAPHQLELATAVMLVEVMRADAEMSDAERDAVIAGLRDKFHLADDELAQLVALAHQASREASDYFRFTSMINDGFDMPQKLRMVEHMWRVAYADGVLSAHENHVMRRLADLLHIPHGAYVHAKMRAQAAQGL